METETTISFENTQIAFAYKTDKQLKKADFLFSMMECTSLVKMGTRMLPWMIKSGLPVKGIIHNTIFEQFVGGETLQQTGIVAQKLGGYHVQVILDYGVEGHSDDERALDDAANTFIQVIDHAAQQSNIPFMSVKLTGLAGVELLEVLHELMNKQQGSLQQRYERAIKLLDTDKRTALDKLTNRMKRICSDAAEKNVGVLIDAEESWIQDPVDALTMELMQEFNSTCPVIYNTLQFYRHDRLAFLNESIRTAKEHGFILALKAVRGAYMEKERERAMRLGYPSPIQATKADTDRDYNAAIDACIGDTTGIALIVASHNEYSNQYAAGILQEKDLPLDHPHVHFSQLYGMSDNITFNLAQAGYNASKYLPFGPIKDVMPYLMRRAEENSAISGQTGRERSLIKKEIKRREMNQK